MASFLKRLLGQQEPRGASTSTVASIAEADRLIDLGNALEDEGKFEAALACYRKAVAAAPDHLRNYLNIGNALRQMGRFDESASTYREALRRAPDYAPAHFNLGALLATRGDHAAAEEKLREALRLDPKMANAAVVLADVLESTGRVAAAEMELRRALEIQPDLAGAAQNLGVLLSRQDRYDDAEKWLLRATAADRHLALADSALGSLYLKTGRPIEAERAYKNALAIEPDLAEALSGLMFSLNFRDDLDASVIFSKHLHAGAIIERSAGPRFEHWANDPDPNRKIRIGYVSGDLGYHPTALFLRPILERHDRQAFDVFCYHDNPEADDMPLKRLAEHWTQIAGLDHNVVAERIRRDEIDILVELSGHTGPNRLPVLARRPAPVQVTFLGYLNTTGLSSIDYRICDRHTDPEGQTEALHTERLFRMPNSQWCYAPMYAVPVNTQPHTEDPDRVVFGSFNQFGKISDACLDLWCRILMQVPSAVILVLAVPPGKTEHSFRERIARCGVDPSRVLVRSRIGILDYFDAIGSVDIALDTFPYNGATTTFDTLWMGVPLIAMRGSRGISRGSYSILRTLELPELIAETPEEYLAANLKLAHDGAWRADLRASLRPRLAASPLMDYVRYVTDLESGYRQMWREWCRTNPGR